MKHEKFIIITTINPINKVIKKFSEFKDCELVIVADKKTPSYQETNLTFLDIKKQQRLGFKSLDTCPYNAYQRKNIGYLYAMSKGAKKIIETDDDNFPLRNWSSEINFQVSNIKFILYPQIFNAYSEFTSEKIWPRGFPLEDILEQKKVKHAIKDNIHIGIWEGLVNGEADVDAIYRLTSGKKIKFQKNQPLALGKNVYCPFNSQNTFWEAPFFPYLYLPVTVSFRFTDILRGYVAQRCLWEHDACLGFFGPTAFQDRNVHNLMNDFESEISCYRLIKKVIDILSIIKLSRSPINNLIKIYSAFSKNKIVLNGEMRSLQNWIKDVEAMKKS